MPPDVRWFPIVPPRLGADAALLVPLLMPALLLGAGALGGGPRGMLVPAVALPLAGLAAVGLAARGARRVRFGVSADGLRLTGDLYGPAGRLVPTRCA